MRYTLGRVRVLVPMAVAVGAAVAFVPSVGIYFIADDFGLIQLFAGQPPLHVLGLFTRDWTGPTYGPNRDELRPLLALSYQIDANWGASWPLPYHVSNIAVHVANSLLVLGIARGVCNVAWPAALSAGLLFAVLPIHGAAVAWISGRTDSLVALFYLSAFLLFALWRRYAKLWLFAGALLLSALALFTKQNAVMFVPSIVLFDLLVKRRKPAPTLQYLAPYLPFAAATAAYLALRYALFGNVLREHELNDLAVWSFGLQQIAHLGLLLLGWQAGNSVEWSTLIAPNAGPFAALGIVLVASVSSFLALELKKAVGAVAEQPHSRSASTWFFGPAWWLLGSLPLIVTYVSPRHLYIVAAGVAIVAGLALDAAWRSRRRFGPPLASAASVAAIAVYALLLQRDIAVWQQQGRASELALRQLESLARTTPSGALLILDGPAQWEFAAPYVFRWPFIDARAAGRINLVTDRAIWCCPLESWSASTRETLERWSADPSNPPAFVVQWDGSNTMLATPSHTSNELQGAVGHLIVARSSTELHERMRDVFSAASSHAHVDRASPGQAAAHQR